MIPEQHLSSIIDSFRQHYYLPDAGPLIATLGAYAANRIFGAPVWLLVVGPPSGGKTEIVVFLRTMPDVRLAGTLTEASLLSGVPKREHAQGTKGGLLREIGQYGVLLLKDFTSVLAMNTESRSQILAGLREIYDGAWIRRIGSDGGRELSWEGKLGLIGGCTPAIDQHHAVMAALGERFLLYRLPTVDHDALSTAALDQLFTDDFHSALARDVKALLSDLPPVVQVATLDSYERKFVIGLSRLTVRGRSPVERDRNGSKEILLVPDAEAPGRLVQALARLLSGMLAIGCPRPDAWQITRHVALSSMPAIRREVLLTLNDYEDWAVTSTVATAIDHPTNTTLRTLEDLWVHKLILRQAKDGKEPSAGRPYEWMIADWARTILDQPLPGPNLSRFSSSYAEDDSYVFQSPGKGWHRDDPSWVPDDDADSIASMQEPLDDYPDAPAS